MSIIEKAVERVVAARKISHEHNIGETPPGDYDFRAFHNQRAAHERTPATVEPAVVLDNVRLRRHGIVAPHAHAARADDEFRRIKRPLLANATGKGSSLTERGNLIMVSSAVAGEGKTHTAINLALNIARDLDHTVLLIDADVIRRTTSVLLGIADKPGLVDLLHDDRVELSRALLRTSMPRLTVLPAGMHHPQATELLSSQTMARLVTDMSSRYADRIIIFDSPPLLVTVEAQVIAELAGQIVVVVEACRTPPAIVEEAIAMLDRSKPIGLVLNKSRRLLRTDYYGGYYKYQ
ncbi:MAG: XrtA-associated tyrosine autokinase [Gammaproteobacteria bacterium]